MGLVAFRLLLHYQAYLLLLNLFSLFSFFYRLKHWLKHDFPQSNRMEFKTLPETESLREVLLRPAFATSFSVSTTLMIISSYLMEKTTIEQSSAPAVLVHPDLYFNVLTFTIITAFITFTSSHQITRAIAVGQTPPLSMRRLASLPWPLNVICGSRGDRNIFVFAAFTLVFPGLLVLTLLHLASLIVNGSDHALMWRLPLQKYLAWTTLWKFFISVSISVVNYIAAHNPTQSVLVPSRDADAAEE